MNNPKIHHLNCGSLHVPPSPKACCHCLLLVKDGSLTLVDTGIGLLDIADPEERIGAEAIAMAGFQFVKSDTAARQIEALGYSTYDVRDIILTHGDPDHAGGLADFPQAKVHIGHEEFIQLRSGNPRYRPIQFDYNPKWRTYPSTMQSWKGIEARKVELKCEANLFLIPLFGHTLGHCGVAVQCGAKWLLHVGDAYFLRAELETDDHPVTALAKLRAENNELRVASLSVLRMLHLEFSDEVSMLGYHDTSELISIA